MLEQKIEALTAALNANTQALHAMLQGAGPAAPVAAPVAPPAPAASVVTALPNGMPGGPFGAPAAVAAPPAFAPPAAPGAPFTDLTGCTKYAMEAFAILEAKGAGKGEVVTQLIQHLCGSGSINDLPATQYPAFYAELEKQKVA